MIKKKRRPTTGADLVPVLAEWREAIAHLKKARKSLGAWQRHYQCREPELDWNAVVLVAKAKELERITLWYRWAFETAKSQGYSEILIADEDNPFN